MRVYEQYKNLRTITTKENSELNVNDSVGEIDPTPQSRTIFRYYSKISGGDIVTIDPTSIKLMLSSSKGLTPSEKQLQAPSNNSSDGVFVGNVGSTGSSSGPHLHAELGPFTNPGGRGQPITTADVDPYVRIGGLPASNWGGVYSPYGPREGGFHYGLDISGPGPSDKSINGQPITIGGGATIVETGPRGGFGNTVIIKRPDGRELLLAHLQDSSIPADLSKDSVGRFSNTGRAETSGPGSSGISKNGINLKTEFKGVPKALNIIPGRTVLSFISDYDNWISNSKSSSIEPNVWIPEKYKNWQINKVTYEWENGDLRLKIEGIRPWGAYTGGYKIDSIPSFESYRQSKNYSDYYDYIRSSGDLCYNSPDGKNSCAEFCKKPASTDQTALPGAGSPDAINGNFGQGKYTYACSKYNEGESAGNIQGLANAIDSLGIKNKNAVSGIIGNSLQESSVNGIYLNPNAIGPSGELGIFQWNDSRRSELEAYAKAIGRAPNETQTQHGFFVKDMKDGYGGLIQRLNNAQTIEDAVRDFERTYERAGSPAIDKRINFAKEVFDCLK
jgi:hypothetical protein